LKSKFPFGKKKQDDDESEEIEASEEGTESADETEATNVDVGGVTEGDGKSSLKDRLKSGLTSITNLRKLKEGDPGFEKKKKVSRILQVSIGVGVVVILLSDEIFPPDAEVPDAPVTMLKKRPKKKAPPSGEEKKSSEEAPTAEAPATETPVAEPPATDIAATEEPAKEAAPETKAPDAAPDASTETNPDSLVEVTSTEIPTEAPATPETTPVEPTTEPATTQVSGTEPTSEEPTSTEPTSTEPTTEPAVTDAPPATPDSVDGTETAPATDETITDQILQDLEKQARDKKPTEQKKEYVAPPDYEYRGRGLVYNCQGKHWACVDAPSFRTCEENSSSVKYLGKKVECHPYNVYDTTKSCENMQNRMVSASAKTEFCE
jgi:hypothetical protein